MRRMLMITALGLLLLSALVPEASSQPLEVVEVDESVDGTAAGYDQILGRGDKALFHWGLRNSDAAETLYVSISVMQHSDKWEITLSDESLVLQPGEYDLVVLTMVPDEWEDGRSLEVTVRFVFTSTDETSGMEELNARAVVELDNGGPVEDEEMDDFLLFKSVPFDLEWLGLDDTEFFRFVVQLMLWMIVAALVAGIINPVVSTIAARTVTKVDDIIVAIIQWPVFFLVLIYGTKESLSELSLPGHLETQLFAVFNLCAFLITIWMIYRLFKDVLIQFSLEYSKTTDTDVDQFILVPLVEKLGMVLIFILSLVYIFSIVGIDPSALVAGSVVIGMILGFALQDTLSNFFAGIHLTIDQPFRTGDTIILENGNYCRVDRIGMRSVRLYNLFDHENLTIPNNVIAGQMIVNASEPDAKYKVKVSIGAAYGTDLPRVEKILLKLARQHAETIKDDQHNPFVRLKFGDSSVDFTLVCWVDDFQNQWRVAYELRKRIYDVFAREDIEIPFPQTDIHFRDPLPVHMGRGKGSDALETEKPKGPEKTMKKAKRTRRPGDVRGETGVTTGDGGDGD